MEITTIIMSTLGALIVGGVVASFNQKRRETRFSEHSHDKAPPVGNVDKLFDEQVSEKRKVIMDEPNTNANVIAKEETGVETDEHTDGEKAKKPIAVFHLMAGQGKTYGGYDLLQALLSQGLRFGEMNIFHRFQDRNGKGPILFSLAQATEPGTFNIHHMGSLNCKGLSFFMQLAGHREIDEERFSLMIDTINALKKELGGVILDDEKNEVSVDALERCKNVVRELADA